MRWRKGHRLKVVAEAEMPADTREAFGDIQEVLRIQLVPPFFQALAVFPVFLPFSWRQVKPAVNTSDFFSFAERLRANAYTRIYNYRPVPDLCSILQNLGFSSGEREELTEVVEISFYRPSLLLLLFSLQALAIEGPIGQTRTPAGEIRNPSYPKPALLIPENQATPEIAEIYEDVRHLFQTPYVNAEFQTLARWPDFLSHFWPLLTDFLRSPLYRDWEYGTKELAASLARELPGPVEVPAEELRQSGLDDEDLSSIRRILQLFIKNLSGVVLAMALAKIGLEGGTRAATPGKPAQGEPLPGNHGRVA